jgi:hypothetical protein
MALALPLASLSPSSLPMLLIDYCSWARQFLTLNSRNIELTTQQFGSDPLSKDFQIKHPKWNEISKSTKT